MTDEEIRNAILHAADTAEGRLECMEMLLDQHGIMEEDREMPIEQVIECHIEVLDDLIRDQQYDAWC